jgi:biopolymer transport protein ExbD
MIARKRKGSGESPKLDMTPMIDVVFQLLIFFVVTLKQEDILSQLITNRPEVPQKPTELTPDQQDIVLSAEGITYGGHPMSLARLDEVLAQRAKYGKEMMVIIKCTQGSNHGLLVQTLDLCNKNKLSKLSVLSLK